VADASIVPRAQAHEHASNAPMLKKEDGRIDWSRSAREIFNRIRGFAPWPGAYTSFRGQSCHIWGEPASNGLGEPGVDGARSADPGCFFVQGKEVMVRCGGTTHLRLLAVKLEGRKRVSGAEFVNGARLLPGERFGQA
jgi:methionyl-tRNA formyltransferase